MIELDDFESQVLLYSKAHFDADFKLYGLNWIYDGIKALRYKYYAIGTLSDPRTYAYFRESLLRLCTKLGLLDNDHYREQIFNSCYLDMQTLGNYCIKEIEPYREKINEINSAITLTSIVKILGILGCIKVFDTDASGNMIPIIKLKEKNESLVSDYVDYLKNCNSI